MLLDAEKPQAVSDQANHSLLKSTAVAGQRCILLIGMHIVLGQSFDGTLGPWRKAHMQEWMQ